MSSLFPSDTWPTTFPHEVCYRGHLDISGTTNVPSQGCGQLVLTHSLTQLVVTGTKGVEWEEFKGERKQGEKEWVEEGKEGEMQ